MTLQADLQIAARQQATCRDRGDLPNLAFWSKVRVSLLRLAFPEEGHDGPWPAKGRCERSLGHELAYGLRDHRKPLRDASQEQQWGAQNDPG